MSKKINESEGIEYRDTGDTLDDLVNCWTGGLLGVETTYRNPSPGKVLSQMISSSILIMIGMSTPEKEEKKMEKASKPKVIGRRIIINKE